MYWEEEVDKEQYAVLERKDERSEWGTAKSKSPLDFGTAKPQIQPALAVRQTGSSR